MKLNENKIEQLKDFLVLAKTSTYAAGDSAKKIKNNDFSTTLVFENNDWKYHDNYFGGEPYGGREIVFYKNKPIWMMVYYGAVTNQKIEVSKIYNFLMKSLKKIPKNNPYRGPQNLEILNYLYENKFSGEIGSFSGKEEIFVENKPVFFTKFSGGFVDI